MAIDRRQVSDDEIDNAISELRTHIRQRIEKHGNGALVGRHETMGIVTEEYHELVDALRHDSSPEAFIGELFDVAIACVFGIVSTDNKHVK